MAEEEAPGGGGGFSFQTRYAGVPAWTWLGLVVGGTVLWFYVRTRGKSATPDQPTTNTVTVPGADSADVQGQLATVLAQIRDLQGQSSTPSQDKGVRIPAAVSPQGPHTTGPLTSGTTLQQLATVYWGDPSKANWLYFENQQLIEEAAKKAGYPDSDGGRILVPGINLWVPPPLEPVST